MHDGRFSSLQQVLDHYSEHLKQKHLSPFLKGSSNKTGATSLQLSAHEKKSGNSLFKHAYRYRFYP